MKIVVIGSGGRLGAALLREYREKFEVTGFNRAQLDLANEAVVRKKLQPLDFNVLINAAAFTNVDLCETQQETAFRINSEAPRALAEICRDKNAKLIHFSTDYVFDGKKREPYTEKDEAHPISVYGESKLAFEKILRWYDQIHGLKFVSLRYFNAAGADPTGELGESHDPETHLIPLVIDAALGRAIRSSQSRARPGPGSRSLLHFRD